VDEVKTDVAERERVTPLLDRDDPVGQRPAIRSEHRQRDLADAMMHAFSLDVHRGFVRFAS
jgi:hypothetical protein